MSERARESAAGEMNSNSPSEAAARSVENSPQRVEELIDELRKRSAELEEARAAHAADVDPGFQ